MEQPRVRSCSMRIQFGKGSTEPKDQEIFNFLKSLKIPCEDLLGMYRDPNEFCVYVKFKSEELLEATLGRLPSSVTFLYATGAKINVTLSSATCVFKYVRLFNLPLEIEDKEIANVLHRYGKIQRLVREKYPAETGYPIWSSVRGIHMEITTEIPAVIHVRNFQARVYYEGLKNKCFVCGSPEHQKADCPKRRSSSKTTAGTSFKDVLAGGVQEQSKEGNAEQATECQMSVIGTLTPRGRAMFIEKLQASKGSTSAGGVSQENETSTTVTTPKEPEGAATVDNSQPDEDTDAHAESSKMDVENVHPGGQEDEEWKTIKDRKRGRRQDRVGAVAEDSLSESEVVAARNENVDDSTLAAEVPKGQSFLRWSAISTRSKSKQLKLAKEGEKKDDGGGISGKLNKKDGKL